MAGEQGSAKRRAQKDRERAAFMKAHKVERTTARCGVCYAIVTRESWKSRYTHHCWSR